MIRWLKTLAALLLLVALLILSFVFDSGPEGHP